MTEPAAGAARRRFLQRRRRVLGAVSLMVAALAAFTTLLVAPNRLAGLRLGEVALAWWAVGALALIGLVAVRRGVRGADPVETPDGRTSRLLPLGLALVWGSPALWLALPPLLWHDGIRGLWPVAVACGGAVLALLVLGAPFPRADGLVTRASEVVRVRWPGAHGCQHLLGTVEALVAGLFVWAQLAAVRELGATIGWPRATTLGATTVVALAAALLSEPFRIRLGALGGGLALLGFAIPLALVALSTTVSWPGVWSAVASRPRIAFIEGTPWTLEGGVVRGPDATPTMRFTDEQRVVFVSRGTVTLEPRDGRPGRRDVQAGEEMSLHPGDQLTVPDGLHLRFEPGRRVPDAPDSGPAWVASPSRSTGLPGLLALGLTGLLGTLGLPAGVIGAGAGGPSPRRDAQLTVGLVMVGAAVSVAWSLYAVWLIPEAYAGGVVGAEVYALPASMVRLGEWRSLVAGCGLGGLALGSTAAALVALRPLAGGQDPAGRPARSRLRIALLVLGIGALACLVPAASWPLLLLALGLGASGLAPATTLACWSDRATAGGVVVGVAVGLVAFVAVAIGGLVSPAGAEDEWWAAAVAGPAVVAVPAHLLAAWLFRARRGPAQRLPTGAGDLAVAPPSRTG